MLRESAAARLRPSGLRRSEEGEISMKTTISLVVLSMVVFCMTNCGPGPETPADDGGNVTATDGGPIADGGTIDSGIAEDGGPAADGGQSDGGTDGGTVTTDGGPADAGTDPCDMYEPTTWATGWRCDLDEYPCDFVLETYQGICYFACYTPGTTTRKAKCFVVEGWSQSSTRITCAYGSPTGDQYVCLRPTP